MAAARTGTTTTGRPPSHRSDRAHRSLWLRWAGAVLVALALVLAFVTLRATADGEAGPLVTSPSGASSTAPPTSAPSPGSTSPGSAAPTSSATARSSHAPAYRPGREPTALVAGSIDVRAVVVPIAAVGRTLTPPSDYREVGWWSGGAKAGSSRGSVLLTGHTVHTGGGVFNDLRQMKAGEKVTVATGGDPVTYRVTFSPAFICLRSLKTGEKVTVATGGDPVTYRVTAVRYLTKAALAGAAPHLFDPAGPPRLVLVTCESWDGAEYDGNTVVVATPV